MFEYPVASCCDANRRPGAQTSTKRRAYIGPNHVDVCGPDAQGRAVMRGPQPTAVASGGGQPVTTSVLVNGVSTSVLVTPFDNVGTMAARTIVSIPTGRGWRTAVQSSHDYTVPLFRLRVEQSPSGGELALELTSSSATSDTLPFVRFSRAPSLPLPPGYSEENGLYTLPTYAEGNQPLVFPPGPDVIVSAFASVTPSAFYSMLVNVWTDEA